MKFLLVFVVSLGIVQAIVQEDSDNFVETLSSPLHAKLVKEFGPAGNEKCENEKIVELSKGHTKCTQKNRLVEISEVNNFDHTICYVNWVATMGKYGAPITVYKLGHLFPNYNVLIGNFNNYSSNSIVSDDQDEIILHT